MRLVRACSGATRFGTYQEPVRLQAGVGGLSAFPRAERCHHLRHIPLVLGNSNCDLA